MKFLANSKYLKAQIKKAFEVQCKVYKRNDDNITFYSETQDPSVWTNLSFIQKDSGHERYFNPVIWSGVMRFLGTIPEQPITVNIDDDEVEVYCVKVFK